MDATGSIIIVYTQLLSESSLLYLIIMLHLEAENLKKIYIDFGKFDFKIAFEK